MPRSAQYAPKSRRLHSGLSDGAFAARSLCNQEAFAVFNAAQGQVDCLGLRLDVQYVLQDYHSAHSVCRHIPLRGYPQL